MLMHLYFMCTFTTLIFELLSATEKMRTCCQFARIVIKELTLTKLGLLQPSYQLFILLKMRYSMLMSRDGGKNLLEYLYILLYLMNFLFTFHVSVQIGQHQSTTCV